MTPADPPVLYELFAAPLGVGDRYLVHVLHDPEKQHTVASHLKKVIRQMGSELRDQGLPETLNGLIFRYAGSEDVGKPALLMRFSNHPTNCELIPIEPHMAENYEYG